ncbi:MULTISPECIES: hypothetical protein [Streptomyces]|uniref:Uncharacterized protein n=1 Tax=Streptomyces microflavus TaxID=1919 RepID=A0A6N9V4J9_STRMI|nr:MULTISPECIES: hypothetical protein [Streptomyces]MEE1728369.1 hypothetical protein [Streptomyces sp. BE282]NEB65989.1 hypothetical protein [Streptomyces microflavus]NEE57277.1 hypothetical protein [Streptomyces sp. SID8455]
MTDALPWRDGQPPEPSSVDHARQDLNAARDTAKKNGATSKKPKRRTTAVLRRDGRFG